MTSKSWIKSLFAVVLAALMVLAAAPSQAAPPGGSRGKASAPTAPGKPITVMTRNVYLGADINRPITAALTAQAMGGGPPEILVALANGTEATRAIVDDTDFTVRAALLADEIARTSPDLIGLQEVALWRSGPLELTNVGTANATQVDYDFLQLLLAELTARGAHYTPAVVGTRADVESPGFTGSPFKGTMGGSMRDIRLTMHDVILVRDSASLKWDEPDTHDAVYATNLSLGVLGVTFRFDRGYQWVDVRAGGRPFRFVNTHLEAFGSNLALAQAKELVAEATAADTSTVLVCDCNSDPLNSTIKRGDTVPHKAPYEHITQTFTDQWLQWAPAEQGWTSGLNERVDEAPPSWTHRIDMVFGRTATGGPLGVDRGEITGDELADRDPATGLWPSDHAGVVLRLRGL